MALSAERWAPTVQSSLKCYHSSHSSHSSTTLLTGRMSEHAQDRACRDAFLSKVSQRERARMCRQVSE